MPNLEARFTDDAGLRARIWFQPREEAAYRTLPALAAYIDRIDAKQFNFRRFGVIEMGPGGYPRQVASITLDKDGSVIVSDKDFAPTKEEAEAIAPEVLAAQETWPKSINANRVKVTELRKEKLRDRGGSVFVCFDRQPKDAFSNVIMVQHRVERDDGKKDFFPWTYWSDGNWRCMEPDKGLPFWKPEKARSPEGGDRIMIHEGPKTAKAVTDLLSKPKELVAHPFGEILAQYEHWGMLGGAYRAKDVVWKEVHAAKPAEVVYVCDNDYPGKSALPEVSRHYGKALKGVEFKQDWREGWDLADEMPAHLFSASTNKYIGPKWGDLLKAATWATKSVPNPAERGPRIMKVMPEFAQEWIHSVRPEVFIHRDWPFEILTRDEFNNKVRPFSGTDDTARLLKADNASKTAILAYRPDKPPGIFAEDATTYFNTHIASAIEPVDGPVTPFTDFMAHLVPDAGDRLELMRWVATLIARPDIKMLYGVLLISEEQGIGKGTLGEKILTPLIGKNNVSIPPESEIVDSNYNYWAAHKRLAVVHEIYAGHSAKAYNKLKSVVTDKYITVSKKFQAIYEIENWMHIFACSNSKNALRLSMDDRRWFVPKLTEKKKPPEYWAAFNCWLTEDEGLGKIKHWASEFLKTHQPVMTGVDAPWSGAKKEVVEAGYTQGMLAVADLLDLLKAKGQPVVITDTACVEFIKGRFHDGRASDRLEKPATIRKVARAVGWAVGEERVTVIGSLKAHLIATDANLLMETPGALHQAKGVSFYIEPPTDL